MDIKKQARLLLERVANSVYDRDRAHEPTLFFTLKETAIVEEFLEDFLKKSLAEMGIY